MLVYAYKKEVYMSNKKLIIIISSAVVAILGIIVLCFVSLKPIETLSSTVFFETESVAAGSSGTFKNFVVEDYQTVKAGDEIAEIEVEAVNAKCLDKKASERKHEKAVADYENAAIMYKDGVITQEQYDASLEKFKEAQAQSACGTEIKQIEKIYALNDGKVFLGEFNEGDEVHNDSVLAEIGTSAPVVHAYFSPKIAKRIKPEAKAQISIVKYPEKQFTGTVKSLGAPEVMGTLVVISINEDVSDLRIKNGDSVVVKINRK